MESNDLFLKLNFLSDPILQKELMEKAEIINLKKGDVVVKEGQFVSFLPIVLEGAIRVFQQKEDREILLYYVRKQETCTMSLSAAYFNNKSSSHGVAVEDTEALIFRSSLISEWQLKFPSWNKYIMKMFRTRYDELIDSFEQLVFDPINVRVLDFLKKKILLNQTTVVSISHKQLANELGTTRVVISRILKQFERNGKIKLHRGSIEVPN